MEEHKEKKDVYTKILPLVTFFVEKFDPDDKSRI